MNTYVSTVDTPAGPFTTVVDGDGVVLASGWTSTVEDLLSLVPLPSTPQPRADLGDATKAVVAYHDGDLTAIDEIPVRQAGGPFLAHAWTVLRRVPAGAPVTYTTFADLAGRPGTLRCSSTPPMGEQRCVTSGACCWRSR